MRALVTGAAGFTGRALTRRLLRDGVETTGLVRDASAAADLVEAGARLVEGSVADKAAVAEAMRGVDTVFHLATVFRRSDIREAVYEEIHVEGTRCLLDACLHGGVSRVVHCSSVGVHGDVGDAEADENAPFQPADIYQRTKLEGEKVALAYHRDHGLPVSVIRPTGIYGPSDERLCKLFRLALARFPMILGNGAIHYHLVHVDDLVEGMILAAEKPEAEGEAFILGGGANPTLAELIHLIQEVSGRPKGFWKIPAYPFQLAGSVCERVFIPLGLEPPLYRRRVDFFTKSRRFTIRKARELLGYSPKVGLKDGIAETMADYKARGWIGG